MPPAARVTDMHVCPMVTGIVPHVGGPILPPGVPTVLIDFLPAATVTSMATCVGPPDVIVLGSMGVMIGGLPAARMGDMTAHGGVIVLGSMTCIIGEVGAPSPGAVGVGGISAGLVAAGVSNPAQLGKSIEKNPVQVSVPASIAPSLPATPSADDLNVLEINGLKPVQVRAGTTGKIAVVGRCMADTVEPYAEGLQALGQKPETFNGDQVPASAQVEWNKLKAEYAPELIPDDVVRKSQMYKANQAWAQKLADQGYTVCDMGDPAGRGPSQFYNMERSVLFGGDPQ